MRIAIVVLAITLAAVSGFLLRDLIRGGPGQGAAPFEGERPEPERQTGEPGFSEAAQVVELREMLEWEIDQRERLTEEFEQLRESVQRIERERSAPEDDASSAPARHDAQPPVPDGPPVGGPPPPDPVEGAGSSS